MMQETPLVSICCITYNHEPYIRKCLDGFLMQKVDFPIEIIIGEDCSTDKTRQICEEYAKRHPHLINLLPSEHNLGCLDNEYRVMKTARGKYIAFCEGDDYWTEPTKLQRQVDFLESHPEYTVCFHNRLVERKGEVLFKDKFKRFCKPEDSGFDLTMDMLFYRWITYPFSMLFRRECLDLKWYDTYKYFRDTHQIYHFLKQGKGYIMNFVGGVRVVHEGSITSIFRKNGYYDISIKVAEELYSKNRDFDTKKYYETVLQKYLYAYKEKKWCYALKLFNLNKDTRTLFRNLVR